MTDDVPCPDPVDLSHLSRAEVAAGYRRICGAVLIQAALSLRRTSAVRDAIDKYSLDRHYDRVSAERWVAGGDAQIPFEEACEALDMQPDYVRDRMGMGEGRGLQRHP